jgi:hypothetical protein
MIDYSDFEPSDKQFLNAINEKLKTTNDHLLWIKSILILLTIIIGGYLLRHQ